MFSGTRKQATAYSPAGLLHFSVLQRSIRMSKFIVRFLAILGGLWIVGLFIALIAVIGPKGRIPSKTILEANFEEPFLEDIPDTPQAKFLLKEQPTLRDVVDAIDR